MSKEVGCEALSGVEEYIDVKLFEAVDFSRNITGRGKSIIIYDSKADMNSPSYWQHNNIAENGTSDVPAGFKVHVIGATVKFI
ncbi:conserved hypothetical protein [Histoplasma capsulatum var. duboisii H88]|nr:conserved hypothetical protein [Histoplasma capsulatum var. duboisii H88]